MREYLRDQSPERGRVQGLGQSPLRGRVPALYGRSRQEALDIKGVSPSGRRSLWQDGPEFHPPVTTRSPQTAPGANSALSRKPTQSARVSVGGGDPQSRHWGTLGSREGGT